VTVTKVGDGVYRVEQDGRLQIVYVAGSAGNEWAFWRGQVFHVGPITRPAQQSGQTTAAASQPLSSPMPATVVKVLVTSGTAVRKGDTLLVLEAMKMELPLRAPSDATVSAIHCKEGDLVQPDMILVELQ
jgi:3-methylcrotonyl-CoA carboxylase alpha subunit